MKHCYSNQGFGLPPLEAGPRPGMGRAVQMEADGLDSPCYSRA